MTQMKINELVTKIKNDVENNIFNKSDELVIIGLRIIELLEQKGINEDVGRTEPTGKPARRPARPRPKRKPFSTRPGWKPPVPEGNASA